MVGWAIFAQAAVEVTQGQPKAYASSMQARRQFCADCGTGLFYVNADVMPGMVDIQSATLDQPDALPPQGHVQVAERIAWMAHAHELPAFDRYPPATRGP